MAEKKLSRKFLEKPTLRVAQDLLGQVLVRKIGKKEIRGIICETEAYVGSKDKACHASRGRTPRSEVLFWEAGRAYVYLIYGMHYCFNVVTEKKEYPAAVLIRGVIPFGKNTGIESLCDPGFDPRIKISPSTSLRINGPGRVCKFFKIDKKFHGQDLIGNKTLWLERGPKISEAKIKKAPRIGVDYAGAWAKKPWRFWVK